MKVIFFFAIIAVFRGVTCVDYININRLFDFQLSQADRILREHDLEWIPLFNVTVRDWVFTDAVLGNIAMTERKGNAIMWTTPNTIHDQLAIGIDKLMIFMKQLSIGNSTFNEPLIIINSAVLSFTQTTISNETSCVQTYSNFTASNPGSVYLIYDQGAPENITEIYNANILTEVNSYIRTNAFLNFVNTHMNACDFKILNHLDRIRQRKAVMRRKPIWPII